MEEKETPCILSYGYSGLDNITGGLHPGELILVGARPGMGSSRFVYNVLANLCNYDYVPAVYVSEHSSVDYIFDVLEICSDLPAVENSTLDPWATAFSVCDFTLEIAEIRKHLQEACFSILVIDAVRLVSYSETNEKGTPNDFGNFFVQLKELAKEFSLPIIVVAKWPRVCETRYDENSDARPLLDDFSETIVSEKNFDTILFLYRNDYYYFDSGDLSAPNWQTNVMEVIVAKSLCKNTGICKLHYNAETSCISEIK